MKRAFVLLAIVCGLVLHANAESVATYRARLQRAEVALRPQAPRAKASAVLKSLAKTTTLQRSDGDQQTADGAEWSRRAASFSATPTGEQVARAHEAVAARLQALDEWTRGDFAPADENHDDAQGVVRQLEASGQIRIGPTWTQLAWARFLAWGADVLKRLFGGAAIGMPSGIGAAAYWLFWGVLAVFVALIGWFLLRAVANYRTRSGAKRKIIPEGENADLLIYGPDELKARARRFAQAGDFREALRHQYVAMLLQFDARGAWRYDPRRTNWEMVAQLRGAPRSETQSLAAPMSDLTRCFDRVRYGNAPFDADAWSNFERDSAQLERQLPTASAA